MDLRADYMHSGLCFMTELPYPSTCDGLRIVLSKGRGNRWHKIKPNSSIRCFMISDAPIFFSFSQVDNISAAVMDLKKKKIRSLSDEAKIGAHGKPVIFLHPKDCGGVLVELEQA
jgi:methylmalonyl-CoA epimerase